MRWKLAFSSNAFVNYSLKDTIKILSNIGYQGIEIMADIPHMCPLNFCIKDLVIIKQILEEYHLHVSNINAFTMNSVGDTYRPSWIEREDILREKRFYNTCFALRFAEFLECRTVSTEPGGLILEKKDKQKYKDIFLEEIKKIYFYIPENIQLLIEPEPGLLLESTKDFLEFYSQINKEKIGLNLDIGHIYCVEEDFFSGLRQLIPIARHIHIEDIADKRHYHLLPPEGDINFHKVFELLWECKYEGWITIELYPYKDNPIYAAEKAFDFFTNIINEFH